MALKRQAVGIMLHHTRAAATILGCGYDTAAFLNFLLCFYGTSSPW